MLRPRRPRLPRRPGRVGMVMIASIVAHGCHPGVPTTSRAGADENPVTTTTSAPSSATTTTAPTTLPAPAPTTTSPLAPAPTTAPPAEQSPTTVPVVPPTTPPVVPTPPTTPTSALRCAAGTPAGAVTAPAGAVVITPADDATAITSAHGAGTTYWFAPGTHSIRAVIDVQTRDRFTGGPGAILDGGYRGVPALSGGGTDVTIDHLTIQRFGTEAGHGWVNGAAVNRSVAARWTIEDSTIRLNDGNAVFLGDGSVTRRNCFEQNGQTGLSAPAQTRNGAYISLTGITVTDNDIRGNNRNNLEAAPGACRGCTGGMKLWQTTGSVVRGNVVADNHGVGIWLDNNNADATIADNIVSGNDREGIMVETSYNTAVTGNQVTGNAVVNARSRGDNFPVAGIFISNSGGSSALPGTPAITVSGNRLVDNWSGVVVFWDADRYCSSASDSSVGHCTLGGPSVDECADNVSAPTSVDGLIAECHWQASAVRVTDNDFVMSTAMTDSCAGRCGRNGLIASSAPATTTVRRTSGQLTPVSNPLTPTWARDRVADPAVNRFWGNRYVGAWRFDLRTSSQPTNAAAWRAAGQDASSVG